MTRSQDVSLRVQGLQPVQVLAALVGLVYLVGGIVGFARTGFAGFTANGHQVVLVFAVNPLQNLVHVVIGALGLLMSLGSGAARAYGWLLFVVFGVLAVWGFMLVGVISGNPAPGVGNPLNFNAAGNWLHLVTAVVGLVIAIMPARKVALMTTAEAAATTTVAPAEPTRQSGGWRRRGHTAH